MLVRDWPELLGEVADLEAPADVTPYVMARINAAHSRTASRRAADRRGASGLGTPMRWLVAGVSVVVVVLVLAIAAHSRDAGRSRTLGASQQSSALIVPGVRIGPAAIGDTRRQIERSVGKPDRVVRAQSGDGIVATYSDASLIVTYRHVANFGDIRTRGRQAVQIRTTSPRYATAAGVRVGSTLSSARRAYPGIRCYATDLGGGNDCVFRGTTFEVWEGIQAERPYKIQAISVAGTGSTESVRPALVTDPSKLILSTWLDPPQAEIKARPGDKVLEVQTVKHLTGPQEVAVEWVAAVRALTTPSVRIVGVGFGDIPKEQVNTAAKGAASFTFHDRPKPIRHALSSAELRALATTRAADIGLRLTQLAVIGTPLGPAVSIIATPTDGDVKAFAKKSQSPGALLKLPVVGTLVQVVDSDNKVALADGEAFGTWIWVDPSLHLCQGLACQ